jgi:Tfp pilus assembly protein PilF
LKNSKRKPAIILPAIIVPFIIVLAIILIATTNIPGGKVGVVEKSGELALLESGIHILPRWRSATTYPVDPSEISLQASPLTPRGEKRARIRLEIAVGRDDIPRLHRSYGGEYIEKLIRPLAEDAIARSEATGSGALADDLRAQLAPSLETFGIRLYSVHIDALEAATSDEDRRIAALASKHGAKVVILGIDAMDWEIYEEVRRDIPMPNIERLRAEGATGDLLSMEPPVSPMIWTTIATGVEPEAHGIIDFLMKDPRTGQDVPITSAMRKVPAIWNITTRFGLTSGFIGWLGSYPAEPVRGFQVSDRVVFHTFDPRWRKGEGAGAEGAPAAGPGGDLVGLTYPEDLVGELRTYILTQEDIRHETLRRYIRLEPDEMPRAARTFDPLDPVVNLAHIIASNTTYEEAAAYTYEKYRPDILAVYLDMVDAVCHLFIKHMRPHTDDVSEEEAGKYGTAIAAAYSHTDSLIGEWIGRIDDETTLIVVSDHGFKHGDLRPSGPSAIGGGQAVKWHRIVGAVSFYGNHVKPGAVIQGAAVRDVCPTVLRLLGLPVAGDMSGRVLEEALDDEWLAASSEIKAVESYGSRSTSGAVVRREEEEDAIMRRLQALGYVSAGETAEVTDYTKLAGSYFAKGEFDKAIDIWEAIVEEDPDNAEILTSIANAQLQKGDLSAAEQTARRAIAADSRFYPAHNMLALCYINTDRLVDAEQLANYVVSRDPGNAEAHFNLGVVYDKMGLNSRALSAFEKSVELRGDYDESRINLGSSYIKAGRIVEAREQLETALEINPRSADAHYLIGNAYRLEGDIDKALESYRQAVRIVPAFNPARISMAIIYATGGDLAEARSILEEAVQYGEELPLVYTNLGIVFRKMGDDKQAERHFRKAIEAQPGCIPARLDLARLYLDRGEHDRARVEAEEVLRIDPANAQARVILANIR